MPRMTGVETLDEISPTETDIEGATSSLETIEPADEPTETVIEPVVAPAEAAPKRRPGWVVPLIAALLGSLIGGGLVALLDDNNSSTSVVRFGNNSSVLARAKDI